MDLVTSLNNDPTLLRSFGRVLMKTNALCIWILMHLLSLHLQTATSEAAYFDVSQTSALFLIPVARLFSRKKSAVLLLNASSVNNYIQSRAKWNMTIPLNRSPVNIVYRQMLHAKELTNPQDRERELSRLVQRVKNQEWLIC